MRYEIILLLTFLNMFLPQYVKGYSIITIGPSLGCRRSTRMLCAEDRPIRHTVKCLDASSNWNTNPFTQESCSVYCNNVFSGCSVSELKTRDCFSTCCAEGAVLVNGQCQMLYDGCADGYYSTTGVAATSADQCVQCPAGRYGTGGITCTDCPAGKYTHDTGRTQCSLCGFQKIGVGSPGAASEEAACEVCPGEKMREGTYVGLDDLYGTLSDSSVGAATNVCVWPCNEYQYLDRVGLMLNGVWTWTGPGNCWRCDQRFAGTPKTPDTELLEATRFHDKCIDCAAEPSHRACTNVCPTGSFSSTGRPPCEFCPAGWSNPEGADSNGIPIRTSCENLREGLEQCEGANALVHVMTSKYPNEGFWNRGECMNCGNRPKNGDSCGSYCPSGSTVWNPNSVGDKRVCETCPIGTLGNKSQIKELDTGDFEAYSPTGLCRHCDPGRYKAMEYMDALLNVTHNGHKYIEQVNENTVRVNSNAPNYPNVDRVGVDSDAMELACKKCPAGRYALTATYQNCMSRKSGDDGYHYCDMGLTSEDQCRKCRAGMYLDEAGQFNYYDYAKTKVYLYPEDVNARNIQSKMSWFGFLWRDAMTCKTCPAGYFSTPGASSCEQCGDGHFILQTDNGRVCRRCPNGRFSLASDNANYRNIYFIGDKPCRACGKGTYGFNNTCAFCPAGRFSDIKDAEECKECPLGKYIISAFATKTGLTHGRDLCGTCNDGEGPSEDKTMCVPCTIVADAGNGHIRGQCNVTCDKNTVTTSVAVDERGNEYYTYTASVNNKCSTNCETQENCGQAILARTCAVGQRGVVHNYSGSDVDFYKCYEKGCHDDGTPNYYCKCGHFNKFEGFINSTCRQCRPSDGWFLTDGPGSVCEQRVMIGSRSYSSNELSEIREFVTNNVNSTGCKNSEACNYNSSVLINRKELCVFPESGEDCDGECLDNFFRIGTTCYTNVQNVSSLSEVNYNAPYASNTVKAFNNEIDEEVVVSAEEVIGTGMNGNMVVAASDKVGNCVEIFNVSSNSYVVPDYDSSCSNGVEVQFRCGNEIIPVYKVVADSTYTDIDGRSLQIGDQINKECDGRDMIIIITGSSSVMTTCPDGEYSFNGECLSCSTCNNVTEIELNQCEKGTSLLNGRNTMCECADGYYFDVDENACIECSVCSEGDFVITPVTSCNKGNKTNSVQGQDAVCTCEENNFVNSSGLCEACSTCGAHQSVVELCSIGTTETLGSDTKCACDENFYFDVDTQTCVACSQCGNDQEFVANCTRGDIFSNVAGTDTTCQCTNNTYYYDAGTETCAECSTCGANEEVERTCLQGSILLNVSGVDRVCNCEEGYFYNSILEECIQCSTCGINQEETTQCERGSINMNISGSDAQCDCIEDYYFNGETCQACSQCDSVTEEIVSECFDGSVSANVTGTDTVCGCKSGEYFFNTTLNECSVCTVCEEYVEKRMEECNPGSKSSNISGSDTVCSPLVEYTCNLGQTNLFPNASLAELSSEGCNQIVNFDDGD